MDREEDRRSRLDLGLCIHIRAESVGRPGHRFFRLRVEAERGSALLWIEKEELFDLAMAIKRLMDKQPNPYPSGAAAPAESLPVDHEFKVAGLAIGVDEADRTYVLTASRGDTQTEAGNLTHLAFHFQGETLDQLADEAFIVCASGRPRCPLCSAPLNEEEAHVCPLSNGHRHE